MKMKCLAQDHNTVPRLDSNLLPCNKESGTLPILDHTNFMTADETGSIKLTLRGEPAQIIENATYSLWREVLEYQH